MGEAVEGSATDSLGTAKTDYRCTNKITSSLNHRYYLDKDR